MNHIEYARQLDYVREAGANAGNRVEAIQKWCGGMRGESWCAYLVSYVLDFVTKGKCALPRMGSCEAIRQYAIARGWIVKSPRVGDLYVYVKDNHAHHIGFVTSVATLTGIAGNTSPDGTSSNGDGVYEHAINASVCQFIRVPGLDAIPVPG